MSTESVKSLINFEKCSVILLDIAGTTTKKSFIKETLYSYVTKHAEEFLKAKWEDEIVREAVKMLKEGELDVEKTVNILKEFTDEDSHNTGFKKLQALIWQKGYESGELKSSVFPDVSSALESWSKSRKIAIYSTGNASAQQEFFTHTENGDLSSYIQKYFDETVGPKSESESYEKIAKELEVKPDEIIFITDDITEAKAAQNANVSVVLVTREGNDPLSDEISKEYMVISSFKELTIDKVNKRKIEEEAIPTEEQQPTKVAKTENSTTVAEKTEAMEIDSVIEKKTEEKTEESQLITKTDTNPEENSIELVESEDKMDVQEKKSSEKSSNSVPGEVTIIEKGIKENNSGKENVSEDDKKTINESETDKPTELLQVDDTQSKSDEGKIENNENTKSTEKNKSVESETKQVEEVDNKNVTETKKNEVTGENNEDSALKNSAEKEITEKTLESENEKDISKNNTEQTETSNDDQKASVDSQKKKVESNGEAENKTTNDTAEKNCENSKAETTAKSEETETELKENAKVKEVDGKINEKENKSELANGVESNDDSGQKINGDSSAADIQVKKVEEPVENNAPVTVEG